MRIGKEAYNRILKLETEQKKIKNELKNLSKIYYVKFVHEEYVKMSDFLYNSGKKKQHLIKQGDIVSHRELMDYMNLQDGDDIGKWKGYHDNMIIGEEFIKYLPVNNVIVVEAELIQK